VTNIHWLNYLHTLNPSVQAAIVSGIATAATALAALLGVVLTLRSSRKSAREERYLNLKREVYLEAARNYGGAANLLLLPLLEYLPPDRSRDVSGAFTASVSQIALVGNDRSVRAWVRLQTEFGGMLARLIASSIQLKAAQSKFVEAKAEFEKSAGFEKPISPFESLKAGLDAYTEILSQLKRTLEEAQKLSPLFVEAILAAKDDLGIPVDEAAFIRLSEEASKQGRETVKGLVCAFNDWISSEWESYKSSKQTSSESSVRRESQPPEHIKDRETEV